MLAASVSSTGSMTVSFYNCVLQGLVMDHAASPSDVSTHLSWNGLDRRLMRVPSFACMPCGASLVESQETFICADSQPGGGVVSVQVSSGSFVMSFQNTVFFENGVASSMVRHPARPS